MLFSLVQNIPTLHCLTIAWKGIGYLVPETSKIIKMNISLALIDFLTDIIFLKWINHYINFFPLLICSLLLTWSCFILVKHDWLLKIPHSVTYLFVSFLITTSWSCPLRQQSPTTGPRTGIGPWTIWYRAVDYLIPGRGLFDTGPWTIWYRAVGYLVPDYTERINRIVFPLYWLSRSMFCYAPPHPVRGKIVLHDTSPYGKKSRDHFPKGLTHCASPFMSKISGRTSWPCSERVCIFLGFKL